MKDTASHICLCCKEIFIPNHYAPHARYCLQSACRKASKKASQALWLSKPENRDYFCGKDHVDRVRQWRKERWVLFYWRQQKGVRVSKKQLWLYPEYIFLVKRGKILSRPCLSQGIGKFLLRQIVLQNTAFRQPDLRYF